MYLQQHHLHTASFSKEKLEHQSMISSMDKIKTPAVTSGNAQIEMVWQKYLAHVLVLMVEHLQMNT